MNYNNYGGGGGQDFDLTLQFVNDACRYNTYCSAAGCGCGVVNMRDFEMPWPSWQPQSVPVVAVPPTPSGFPTIVAYGPPPGSVVLPPTFAQPCFDWPNEAGYEGEQPPGCLF